MDVKQKTRLQLTALKKEKGGGGLKSHLNCEFQKKKRFFQSSGGLILFVQKQ